MRNCVFCKIAAGEVPASVVYEDDLVMAFLDIAPLNRGHTLLIPRHHWPAITAVPPDCLTRLMQVAPRIAVAAMRATGSQGFNLLLANGACAGQVVPHAHLHVVPRSPADGLVLPARNVGYESNEQRADILARMQERIEP